ncbi:MAG: leucine-rich repeat protein [Clostridia bacterium]|nr:leucine-rich repeat protein [Clostridia bacterium]
MSSTDDRQYHIFLSYRWGDKEAATEEVFNSFINRIKAETGLHVFYDKNELRSGDFVENLRKSAGGAYVFMPVVTDSYISFGPESNRDLDKDFCLFEYLTALENGARVVPVFLDFKTNSTTQKLDYPKDEAERLLKLVSGADLEDHFDEALSKKAEEVAKEDLEKVKLYLRRSQGVKLKTLDIDDEALSSFADVIFDRLFEKSEVGYYADVLDAQKKKRNAIFIPGEGFDDSGLTIEGTYVPVTLERLHTDEEIKTAREKHEELPKELFEDENLREQLMRDKYAVLVGDAGQGKSLAVKKLCIDLGERTKKLGFSKNEFFPMYYECKDFIQSLANDEDFYRALFKGIDLSQPGFEAVLRNCRPLFIFDAMDEVPASTMDILVDKINSVLISNHKTAGVHILFTSRPGQKRLASVNDMMIDQTPMTLVRRYKVQYFDNEKRDKYILKLANVRHESDEKKDTFFEKINEKEQTVKDYKDISRNPFFLFTIFTAYDPLVEDSLPETRFDAVEYAINSVIYRELHKNPTGWEFINEDDIKSILGCLSYKIYRAKDANKPFPKIDSHMLIRCAEEVNEDYYSKYKEKFNRFFEESKLCNETGFSHEFFAEAYAAYFLWTEIKNNAKGDNSKNGETSSDALYLWLTIKNKSVRIKDFEVAKSDSEYWKSVKKTLLLLSDKYSKESYIAESLVEGFQSVNEPDYDLICDAVSQFEKPHIKNRAINQILERMMDRGCEGILTGLSLKERKRIPVSVEDLDGSIILKKWDSSFGKPAWKCAKGTNPYTELFYFPAIYKILQDSFDNIETSNENKIDLHKGLKKYNYVRKELLKELKAVFSDNMHSELALIYEDRKKAIGFKDCVEKMKDAASCTTFKGLYRITSNGTQIEESAFRGRTSLTSIYIPRSVTIIGEHAFFCCTNLSCIGIHDRVTKIGEAALSGCRSLTKITIHGNNTEIGRRAFGCWSFDTEFTTGLKHIEITGNGTRIGEEAFSNNKALTDVKITGNGTEITNAAYRGCTGLTSIEITGNKTKIGGFAFSDCNELTNVEITGSGTEIGQSAFSGCTGLTSLDIPDSVTKIEYGAFAGCNEIEKLTVHSVNSGIGKYYSRNNCIIKADTKELIVGCKNSIIPDDGSVTKIGDSAFSGCSGLSNIQITEKIKEIGKSAFEGCTGLTGLEINSDDTKIWEFAFKNCTGLITLAITGDGTEIGANAFTGCTGLTSIDIPAGVSEIGYGAFSICTELKKITVQSVDSKTERYYERNDCIIKADTKELVVGCKNSIIPDDGSVTKIGDSAFRGCKELENVTIPDSVTEIGNRAFAGCAALTSLVIPDSVTEIGDWAFAGCTGLTEIDIPCKVKVISARTFSYCTGLKRVGMHAGITEIGHGAFWDCIGLQSVFYQGSLEQWQSIDVETGNECLANAEIIYIYTGS